MSVPTLILKTHETPTYFNKEAAIGFLLFPPLGGIVGAWIGKDRMEKEQAAGKVVGEPTGWNKDALLGGLLGQMAGGLVGLIGVAAAMAMEVIAPGGTGLLVAKGIIAASSLAGITVGAMVGGRIGKDRMQREYIAAAIQGHAATHDGHGHAPELSPDMARSQDHAKSLLESRQRTTVQEHGL